MDDTYNVKEISLVLEAIKIGIAQSIKDGYVLRLGLEPSSVPAEIMTSPIGTKYKVVMVEMDDNGNPVASPDQEDGIRALKRAGLVCREPRFWKWLKLEFGEDVANEDEAAAVLCERIGVVSRKVLANDPAARARFNFQMEKFGEAHKRGFLL